MNETLAGLAAALRRLGSRWCILGAQAAVIHGRPRMSGTLDHKQIEGVLVMLESAIGQSDLLPRWRSIAAKVGPPRRAG